MKKIIAASLFILSAAFAADTTVVSILDINEDALVGLSEGKQPDLILQFPAKTKLPLSLFLTGDLVELVDFSTANVEVKKTFYMRKTNGHLFFSSNLTKWERFADFAGSNASFALEIEDGIPKVTAGTNLLQRD